jgi:hypothetical protein
VKRRPPIRPPASAKRGAPTYSLDTFSTADVARWKRQAVAELAYAHKSYFHFEGLRALAADAIRDSLRRTRPTAISLAGWTRIVDYRYSLDPLSAEGSRRQGGRFNIGDDIDQTRFPSFPALYLAEDYGTAYAEKFGAAGSGTGKDLAGHEYALRKPASFTQVRVNGYLQQLFDVTASKNLHDFVGVIGQFKMTRELIDLAREARIAEPYRVTTAPHLKKVLLATDWRRGPSQFGIPANSQVFARLVREAGFEGLLYPSARGSKRCVAVFTDRLIDVRSFLELADPAPAGVATRRIEGG